MPVQLLSGAESTLAARAVTRWPASTMRHVLTQDLPELRPHGPVTAPERVNLVIEQFLMGF